MKTQSNSPLPKRISLLLLPVPVTLCLTILFWSLGGGAASDAHALPSSGEGINAILPAAYFDEKDSWDKFKLYEQASYDSAKYEEARESDPYFDLATFKTQQHDTTPDPAGKLLGEFRKKDRYTPDANEEKVNRKIEELYQRISQPAKSSPVSIAQPDTSNTTSGFSSDVDRLERMMEDLNAGRQADPEMEQIESMLEKILDIQHPERVKQKLQANPSIKDISPVTLANHDNTTNMIPGDLHAPSTSDNTSLPVSNGFFGLEDGLTQQQTEDNIIQAVIHDEQQLVTGATIKLRLSDQVVIDGHMLDRDSFIYGTCSINGERLTIDISSIHSHNTLLKVSLKVYDLDGIEGIYVPGAIAREVAKQSSGSAVQGIQFMSMNTSLEAQAAAAGVEAAKGLFSKKAKLIKVTVKAGYQVLLKNASTGTSF